MSKFIPIATFSTRMEAEVAQSFLRANTIESIIESDDAGGMRSYPFSYVFGVRLTVTKEDAKRATVLLTKENTSPKSFEK